MTTITITNHINGKVDTMTFPTEADVAAAILWLNTEYDASTFSVEAR